MIGKLVVLPLILLILECVVFLVHQVVFALVRRFQLRRLDRVVCHVVPGLHLAVAVRVLLDAAVRVHLVVAVRVLCIVADHVPVLIVAVVPVLIAMAVLVHRLAHVRHL